MISVVRFIFNVVVGIFALLLSIPFILVALIFILGGKGGTGDWLMDNCPLVKWFDYLEVY
jgi:hypothetical protein